MNPRARRPRKTWSLDVVIPTLNEEQVISQSIRRLRAVVMHEPYFTDCDWRIIVADNGSTDRTAHMVRWLHRAIDQRVRLFSLDERGRGRALKRVFSQSKADYVAYMDADLSTDLAAFKVLIAVLRDAGEHVTIGCRLMEGATVEGRRPVREIMSRGYNLIVRRMFATGIRDAQCGFKAMRGDVAKVLLPLVEDNTWFFDTELLLIAEANGYRITEISVDWRDDPDSTVNIWRTAWTDIKGLLRLKFRGIPRTGENPPQSDGVPRPRVEIAERNKGQS